MREMTNLKTSTCIFTDVLNYVLWCLMIVRKERNM